MNNESDAAREPGLDPRLRNEFNSRVGITHDDSNQNTAIYDRENPDAFILASDQIMQDLEQVR